MGAKVHWQGNLFLPLGKARMGYPSGEARWGLMFIGWIDLLKSLTKQSNLFLPFGKGRMGLKVRWGLI